MENIQHKVYPEFGGLTGEEISIRLQALDNLLNVELDTELRKAGFEENGNSVGTPTTPPAAARGEDDGPGTGSETGGKAGDGSLYQPGERPEIEDREFKVIAHRGWSGSYPENTLIGMREAIKLGCHMIEFDVAMTRDRKLIIIHDNTLTRTTDGVGEVGEWDYRALRGLDAGSWFHPKYEGTKLPSLDEVLLISRGCGMEVNIEIKKECWEEELQEDGVEHQLIHAVNRYGVHDRVIVSSFRWSLIERIHKIDPTIRTALLHYKDVGKLDPAALKEKYGIVAFNPHCIDLTQKFVDNCHEAGLEVFPFTVNNYKDMEKYFDMGVDGMFTNHPNRMFKFIDEQNVRLREFDEKDREEDTRDMDAAIRKLEVEEMEKARKRARWRAKRRILEAKRGPSGKQPV